MRHLLLCLALVAFAAPLPALAADDDARVDGDLDAMRRGIGDLFQAARSGHPTLLQDAENEILTSLLDGLDASTTGGKVDAGRYQKVLVGFNEAKHLFRELPYSLEVDPGNGMPAISLPLRKHPWWQLSAHPLQGWNAQLAESGVTLRPR
ncbi:MAG: hypothetical protein JWM80_5800 [Cyanobacteria bacterium RYN_339]|nr:hypothetical protein [Cyanobacteria bacterium RYN_339]